MSVRENGGVDDVHAVGAFNGDGDGNAAFFCGAALEIEHGEVDGLITGIEFGGNFKLHI